MYLMFLAPFDQGGDFRDQAVMGVHRFLNRVWKLAEGVRQESNLPLEVRLPKIENVRLTHKAIKKVTGDIEILHYNTAISALMIYVNELEEKGADKGEVSVLLRLLAPFAPHITEELWHMLGESGSIHKAAWPAWDEAMLAEDTATIAVQINGKTRGTVTVGAGAGQEAVEAAARADGKLHARLIGAPKRVIFVPGKLINFII
jgi:leucyl-tRNA synthetase